MPDAPVAAPPAAPAPPAPSAPAPAASTSAPPAPPTSSAPPSPPAPENVAPAPVAAPPQPPAKFDAQTSATPPNKADYPQNDEGFNQHGEDLGAWVMSHPEEAARLRSARLSGESVPVAEPDAITEAAQKVEGEPTGEAAKPVAAVAPTPARIEEWTGKSAELKDAFAKHPELQAEIMQMARDNEAARPVLDIVGTKEEAAFAVDHANKLVSMQANWMLAGEDPEMVETAWGQVEDMFKSRNEKGEEIKGADGKVQFDADYKPFVRRAAGTALNELQESAQGNINTLKSQLVRAYPGIEKWTYASPELRSAIDSEKDPAIHSVLDSLESSMYEKAAFDLVFERLKSGDPATQLPTLAPDATDAQKAFQKKLETERAELDAKLGKQTVESRKAARQALDAKIGRTWSKVVSDHVDSHIKAMTERGDYLPDFVLNDKWINPQTQQVTNSTDYGARCWILLNNKIYSNPVHQATLARLQVMGAAGEAARLAELTRLTNMYLPAIMEARDTQVQNDLRSRGKKTAASGAPSVARVEPNTQATVMPQAMPDGDLRKWAQTEAAKRPEWQGSNAKEREELVGTIFNQKKFFGR